MTDSPIVPAAGVSWKQGGAQDPEKVAAAFRAALEAGMIDGGADADPFSASCCTNGATSDPCLLAPALSANHLPPPSSFLAFHRPTPAMQMKRTRR